METSYLLGIFKKGIVVHEDNIQLPEHIGRRIICQTPYTGYPGLNIVLVAVTGVHLIHLIGSNKRNCMFAYYIYASLDKVVDHIREKIKEEPYLELANKIIEIKSLTMPVTIG